MRALNETEAADAVREFIATFKEICKSTAEDGGAGLEYAAAKIGGLDTADATLRQFVKSLRDVETRETLANLTAAFKDYMSLDVPAQSGANMIAWINLVFVVSASSFIDAMGDEGKLQHLTRWLKREYETYRRVDNPTQNQRIRIAALVEVANAIGIRLETKR